MQFSVYIPDDLAVKINERLPRTVKVSTISRRLLMGLVFDNREMATFCRENEDEAKNVQPYLVDALSKIYDVAKAEERVKAGVK